MLFGREPVSGSLFLFSSISDTRHNRNIVARRPFYARFYRPAVRGRLIVNSARPAQKP
ncbi:protein of unknown function [Trichlorobacter ammonificans]|uniref:Uncharacterized protein n=1 Tax=Trichlorobacter ammonificans TaxID=2916410 RepID=A0ABM9D856_9BACT|nr:protein of unknown function [Trichlorobacter ammonificans]